MEITAAALSSDRRVEFHNVADSILRPKLKILIGIGLSRGLCKDECVRDLEHILRDTARQLFPTCQALSQCSEDVIDLTGNIQNIYNIDNHSYRHNNQCKRIQEVTMGETESSETERHESTQALEHTSNAIGKCNQDVQTRDVFMMTETEQDMLYLIRMYRIDIACLSTLTHGVINNYSKDRYTVATEEIGNSDDELEESGSDTQEVSTLIEQSHKNKQVINQLHSLVVKSKGNNIFDNKMYQDLCKEVVELRYKLASLEKRSIGVNTGCKEATSEIGSNTELTGEVVKPALPKRRIQRKRTENTTQRNIIQERGPPLQTTRNHATIHNGSRVSPLQPLHTLVELEAMVNRPSINTQCAESQSFHQCNNAYAGHLTSPESSTSNSCVNNLIDEMPLTMITGRDQRAEAHLHRRHLQIPPAPVRSMASTRRDEYPDSRNMYYRCNGSSVAGNNHATPYASMPTLGRSNSNNLSIVRNRPLLDISVPNQGATMPTLYSNRHMNHMNNHVQEQLNPFARRDGYGSHGAAYNNHSYF